MARSLSLALVIAPVNEFLDLLSVVRSGAGRLLEVMATRRQSRAE